jgi:diaminopimelate decarboxylase
MGSVDTDAPVASWIDARCLADEHGSPFYTVSIPSLDATVASMEKAFIAAYPTQIAYAYKANHLPAVCAHFRDLGLLAEVGSDLEWWLARHLSLPMGHIVSNGVNRSERLLREALIGGALVNLHSWRDVEIAVRVARTVAEQEIRVGLRLRVPAAGAGISRFGLEHEDLQKAAQIVSATPGLRLAGLHAHTPGRDVDVLAGRARALATWAKRLDQPLDYLDIGGGLYGGVPLLPDPPTPLDYAQAVAEPLRQTFGTGADVPVLILELGTSLIARPFSYIAEVLDVDSGGVATVAGSLLHTSPNTRRTNFPVTVLRRTQGATSRQQHDVVGSTLIEGEYLAFDVRGPVAPGDFLRFDHVGAYSVGAMTPAFLLPIPPVLARDQDGQWHRWRSAQTPADVFDQMQPSPAARQPATD